MSRDDKASYYDLELPDGTVVEAQDVTRALLERAALPPYASKCLGTLLERVWRFGAKPDTDTAREAEKVVTEATFLCEALGGVPSFTMRDVARAAHDAGIEIKFGGGRAGGNTAMLTTPGSELRWPMPVAYCPGANGHTCDGGRLVECDEHGETDAGPCPHCNPPPPQTYRDRIAELERERDEARARVVELERALDALRQTLVTERQAAVATAEELERVRKELADLRETYDAEMEFRAEMRRELGARDGEGFPDFLRRVCIELSDIRDRYRPRMHGEEPAPFGRRVLFYDESSRYWRPGSGTTLDAECYWMHQPPAPGEGE